LREHVGESVAFVVCDPRFLQRPMRAHREHQGRDTAANDQSDGKDLRPQPPDVAKQLDVERCHVVTT